MPNPQAFFDNTRRNVGNNARIEAAINRLRDEPSQTMAAPKKKKSSHGYDHHQPSQQAARVPRGPTYLPVTGTRYGNLASPTQFMSHYGGELPQPIPKLQVPVTPQKENIPPPSAPAHSKPENTSAKKLPPSSAQPVIENACLAPANITNNLPFKPKALVGLAGSRFAPNAEPKQEPKQEPKLESKPEPKPVPFEHVSQVPQARYRIGLMPHQQAPPAKASMKAESVVSLENNKKSDEDQSTVSLNSSKKPNETDDLFEKLTKVGLADSVHATKSASSAPKYPFAVHSSTSSARSNSEAAANNTDVGSLDLDSPTAAEHPSSHVEVSSHTRSVVSVLSSASIAAGTIKPQSDAPLAGLKSSIWAPTLNKPLVSIRTYPVKVAKNGGKEAVCTLKVTRADVRSPCVLVIEVNETGERLLEESVFHDATFTADSSTITFRASHKGDSSPTWMLEFQHPGMARGAHNMVVRDPYRPISGSKLKSTVSETSPTHLDGSSNSLAQHTGPTPHASLASLKRDVDRQFSELPAAGESTELISIASDSERQDDVNLRISARNFNVLNSLQGGESLVDIDDDDVETVENNERIEEDVAAPSALMDLAVLNDDFTVQSVFRMIDAFYDTFLNKLLDAVEDTKLPHDASTQDFMSSKPHITAAEQLVGNFFGHSNIFAQLKHDEEGAYITDMGWKVLAKALMERDEELANAIVEESNSSANNFEAADGVPVADTNPPANNEPETVTQDSVLSDTESTRGYSVDELLSMRNLAVDVKQELLSKRDMAPRPFRPAPAPSVTRAAASSVGSWQSFANAAPSQSIRSSTPAVPKVGAMAQPAKATEEQPTEAKAAPGASVAPEKSKQGPLPPHLMPAKGWTKSFQPVSDEVTSKPSPTTHQAEGPSTKPAVIMNSWKAFAKTESSAELEKRAQKPVECVQGEDLALDVQSPPATPSKTRLVEVYKARDLTPTTSTTGWKSWAKDTSGVEPAVRAPTPVTPKAVTSTNGWRSFATTESGVEPEKPTQANPAPMVPQSQPSVIQEAETFSKSEQVSVGTVQDKPLPPHLRKPNPTTSPEDVKQVPKTTTQAQVQEKPLPPHLRKAEPTATAVKPAPENIVIPASKTALEDKATPAPSASQVQPSSQDKLILLASISNIQPDTSLPKVKPQHLAADDQPKAIVAVPPVKAATSVGAWAAFAGLKSVNETKVVENSTAVVASKSTTAIESLPKPDLSDTSSMSFKPEPMRKHAESETVKSAENAPPDRSVAHLSTNSECDRLAEKLKALKLEKDEEQKPSLDFFTTAPPAAQQVSMATPHPLLKSAPGLSASRFASGGTQPSFGTQPPRPHVEDTQDDPKPIKFKERVQPPFPTPRPPRSYVASGASPALNSPVMQFSAPGVHHTAYVQNGYQVPSPIAPQPAPLAMTTILVPDPNTGILVEMTGYMKATPLASPQPSPAYPSPFNYENAGYQQPSTSHAPSFPPRSDMYRHVSQESSGSEKQFSPKAPSFKPSPARGHSQGAAETRPHLSPVRREKV
jgi:hypothetical protein